MTNKSSYSKYMKQWRNFSTQFLYSTTVRLQFDGYRYQMKGFDSLIFRFDSLQTDFNIAMVSYIQMDFNVSRSLLIHLLTNHNN